MCASIVRDQLSRKFGLLELNTYQVEVLEQYCEKAALMLGIDCGPSQDVAMFQLAELVHYAKLEDVLSANVVLDSEQSYLNSLYRTHHSAPKKLLADPDTTLSTNVTSERCGRCGSTATLTIAQQTRSVDEPMSFYTHCLKCRHRWRGS